jgi:hypothetical protein
MTRIEGPIFRAHLKTDADSKNSWAIREVFADQGMLLTQESGSQLKCSEFIGDLLSEEFQIRGNPAELVVTQRIMDQDLPERIVSPSISYMAGQLVVQGPLDATFHGRPRDLALNVANRSITQTHALPLYLKATGDLAMVDDRLTVSGNANLSQGNPEKDGFRINGDRFTLLLGRTPSPQPETATGLQALGQVEVLHALAYGAVSFVSKDLRGEGDVMEFEVRRRIVTLFRYKDQGNASLTFQGRWQTPFPRFDLDLSQPENPIVSTSRNVPLRDPK